MANSNGVHGTTRSLTQWGEWKVGWRPTVGASLSWAVGSVLMVNTASVFIPYIIAETGWSTSQALLSPITSLMIAILSPFVGRTVNKIGPRRCALIGQTGIVLTTAIFVSVPLSHFSYYAYGFAFGALGAFAYMVPFNRVVSSWFRKSVGKAFGLLGIAAGIVSGVTTPLFVQIMEIGGWRLGYITLAALTLVIGVPSTLWMLRLRPASLGITEAEGGSSLEAPIQFEDSGPEEPYWLGQEEPVRSVSAGLKSRRVWVFAIAFLAVAIAVGGFQSNLLSILLDYNLDMTEATTIAALFYFATITGRIAGGVLVDRFSRYMVVVSIFSAAATGALLLNVTGAVTPPIAFVCIFLVGVATGVEADMLSYFSLREFGEQSFNVVYGILVAVFAIGLFVGPYLFGILFDMTGSFKFGTLLAIPLFLAGALIMLLRCFKLRRDFRRRPEVDERSLAF